MRIPKYKISHFFMFGLRDCACVCYQHKSKINYIGNFIFGIQALVSNYLHQMSMLFETFYKDSEKNLCTEAHKIQIHVDV